MLSETVEIVADSKQRAGIWEVWVEGYEIKPGSKGRYIVAKEPDLGPPTPGQSVVEQARLRKERWSYQPLVKHRDMFLTFARLADGDLSEEAILRWVDTYGALGLTEVARRYPVKYRDPVRPTTRGGAGDTVAAFVNETRRASETLKLYEAATAPDGPDVPCIASFVPRRLRRVTGTPDEARRWALEKVMGEAQENVARYCYPAPYLQPNGDFVEGYGFANLLGAMWLQMFWLLIYGHKRLCWNPECNRIIVPKRPNQPHEGPSRNNRSGGYATRGDKVFCSKKCRNRHTYLTSTKPRRQAARKS